MASAVEEALVDGQAPLRGGGPRWPRSRVETISSARSIKKVSREEAERHDGGDQGMDLGAAFASRSASGSRSKSATPITAPALKPRTRWMRLAKRSASQPPTKVAVNRRPRRSPRAARPKSSSSPGAPQTDPWWRKRRGCSSAAVAGRLAGGARAVGWRPDGGPGASDGGFTLALTANKTLN